MVILLEISNPQDTGLQTRAPHSLLPGAKPAIQVKGLDSHCLGYILTRNKLGDLSQVHNLSEPQRSHL